MPLDLLAGFSLVGGTALFVRGKKIKHPLDRCRARFASAPQIEHEPGVAECLSSEAGWRRSRRTQILFDTVQQHHDPRLDGCL
jgi:hypothetical protein